MNEHGEIKISLINIGDVTSEVSGKYDAIEIQNKSKETWTNLSFSKGVFYHFDC